MRIISMAVASIVLMGNSAVFAFDAESRWNALPEQKQARLSERAAALGIDITTPEGRQAFREAKKAERTALATEMGFDISTKEGKQTFRQARREQRTAIREQINALPDAEKQALRSELKGLTRQERRTLLAERFAL